MLVTTSGIDGAGKSTFAAGLAAHLRATGRSVTTFAPLIGDRAFTKALRDLPAPSPRPDTGADFLSEYFSRVLVVNGTGPVAEALAAGEVVICDRYLRSHLANQRAFGQDLRHLAPLFDLLPAPTMDFDLHLPVETAMERIAARADRGVGDTAAFLGRVAEYLDADTGRADVVRLDATLAPDQLVERAAGHLASLAAAMEPRR
ncbi:MAG: putative thymidylate kinase [Acidimicrobiales bacterium]|nr:putative thymidylate kinase [Acidimicrobiales bacterium]